MAEGSPSMTPRTRIGIPTVVRIIPGEFAAPEGDPTSKGLEPWKGDSPAAIGADRRPSRAQARHAIVRP